MTIANPETEGEAGDLSVVLDTARDAVTKEVARGERLDAKARNPAVLAGQWFAVAQAVSAVAYASSAPFWALVPVVIAAVVGAWLLWRTFTASRGVITVKEIEVVTPGSLELMIQDVESDPLEATRLQIRQYEHELQERRKANKDRAEALEATERIWMQALAAPLVQLVLALAVRLAV